MPKTLANAHRSAPIPTIAALCAALVCAGCSGFATGGVATLQGASDRVDVTARTASASAGASGIGVSTARREAAICPDPASGRPIAC